jgi:hypothetical protein
LKSVLALACGGAIALVLSGPALAANSAPAVGAHLVAMRRITQEQYHQIIADVFGRTINLGGRFEPDQRDAGLIAVGAGEASVTASGFEQYDGMARSIALQVVDEQHRAEMVPCQPAAATGPDDTCARQFIGGVGRLLYRRPLTALELNAELKIANATAMRLHDFYAGLGLGLSGMLESAQFLFRQETAAPDPDHPGTDRLDAYSKASRLSFLLWNAGPDLPLLAAAERGDLDGSAGLQSQVDRMMKSPRLEAGVRAFFADMLGFSAFESLAKDPVLYPKFSLKVAGDAQEQTLKTIVDLLLTHNGDYRDLFTTRKTFLTPVLAAVYRIPIQTPDDLPDAWVPYEFPAGADQAGIVTEASFVALHSQPGRSSPTVRGKALREILLCQKVPDPPGNVNFAVVQDTANPVYRTARQRLTAHRTQPTCAGCHKIMDPIGLALENFDTTGGFRLVENGVPIDPSGEIDGAKFADAAGLGKALHDNPGTAGCVVNRLYSYAVGRTAGKSEIEWLHGELAKSFASGGYRIADLLRGIATSDVFYSVARPESRAELPGRAKLALAPQAMETRP